MKKWNKFWEKFDSLFDDMEEAIEDFSTNYQSSSSNGATIQNNNGNVVIAGNIKLLKVNGKVIKLDDTSR